MELAAVATNQIERLFDYGIAISVLILVLGASGFLIRILLNRCDQRFKESLDMHREVTNDVKEVVAQNTVAFINLNSKIDRIVR